MKNLEKEYKDQISHEAPDLWSRIEAGVDAYEAVKASESSINASAPVTHTSTDNITPIRKKNVIAIITRITAVAACLLILAATVRVSRRTKNESTAPSPAAEISYSDSAEAAPSSSEARREEVAEATEPISDGFTNDEPSFIYEPVSEAEAKEDSSPSLAPSESAVIKTPVTFDDARDDLLTQLEPLGFKNIKDFTLEDNSEETLALPDILTGTGTDYKIAAFTDSKTSVRYLVYYTESEDGSTILAVRKSGDISDYIYTAPSIND